MTELLRHTSTMQDRITKLQLELENQQTQIHQLQQQLKTVPHFQIQDIKKPFPPHSRYTSPSSEPQHSGDDTMTTNKDIKGKKITTKTTTHNTDNDSIYANCPLQICTEKATNL